MTMVAAQQIAARKTYGGGGGDNSVPAYLEQEVLLWSPEKITLKTYDLFIVTCKRRDARRMTKILQELIGALDFEHGDMPQRLFRLYEYCQRCIGQQRYDDALHVMQGLRSAWAQTFGID